jgi:hypothetical protein
LAPVLHGVMPGAEPLRTPVIGLALSVVTAASVDGPRQIRPGQMVRSPKCRGDQVRLLLIDDRRVLRRASPDFSLSPDDAEALVRHLVRYASAGLSAVAADARREA